MMTNNTEITVSTVGAASTSEEIVEYIRCLVDLEDVRVGALSDISSFHAHTAHVICLAKEEGINNSGHTEGTCVFLIIQSNGPMRMELCTTLNKFWDYWRWEGEIIFPEISIAIEQIRHFFKCNEPKSSELYAFQDGEGNQAIYREIRSVQKCRDLNSLFGFNLKPRLY